MRRIRHGFSLVELLVVIAIISTLAAMLLPSLQRSMESARTLFCVNNQKQFGFCTMQYAADNNGWVAQNHGRNDTLPLPTKSIRSVFLLLCYLKYMPYTPKTDGYYWPGRGVSLTDWIYKPPYDDLHFCPSLPVTTTYLGALYVYGLRNTGFMNINDAKVRVQPIWYIGSAPPAVTKTAYVPSRYVMWGDSLCQPGWGGGVIPFPNQISYFWQDSATLTYAKTQDLSGGGNWGAFHARHSGSGNGWFADGHAESLGVERLIDMQLGIKVYAGPY